MLRLGLWDFLSRLITVGWIEAVPAFKGPISVCASPWKHSEFIRTNCLRILGFLLFTSISGSVSFRAWILIQILSLNLRNVQNSLKYGYLDQDLKACLMLTCHRDQSILYHIFPTLYVGPFPLPHTDSRTTLSKSPKHIPIPLHFGSVFNVQLSINDHSGKESFTYLPSHVEFSGSLTWAVFLNTTKPQ